MKNLLMGIFMVFLVAGCTKNAPGVVADPPPPVDSSQFQLRYAGNFQSGPYGVATGVARVYENAGKLQLRLEQFNVSNGPDLKVYLSREQQPVNFIRLGNLQAVSGDQVYTISGSPDFSQYRFALIHCEKYNHLFGYAELMKQ